MSLEKKTEESGDAPGLENVAESEHEYLHERLRTELGREPTEKELDDP